MLLLYSFGDGVQYPVQLNHLPDHTVNQIGTNYESMGTTTFPAMNTDGAANVQSHELQQTDIDHAGTSENGNVSREAASELDLLHINGGASTQSSTHNAVERNKSTNGTVAIDIVPV